MSLIKPHSLLVYEIADFDACDSYGFLIQNVEDGLTFGSAFVSERRPVSEYTPSISVTCAEDALEAGDAPLMLSQGAVMAADRELHDGASTDTHTPPFMISRTLYARLVSGERVTLNLFDVAYEFALAEDEEAALDEEEAMEEGVRASIEVAGVESLVVTTGDGDLLVVARDATHPAILYMRWDGECYAMLTAVHEP